MVKPVFVTVRGFAIINGMKINNLWKVAACAFIAPFCTAAAESSVGDPFAEMWERPVALREGVTMRALALDKPRLMKAYVVKVDLTTPGIGFTATERDPGLQGQTWLPQ